MGTVRGGREQGREDGSGEERRCGRGGWIDAPFGKPLVDQSPGGGGGGTRNRRLSRREQRRRKQTHEVRGIGRESARVAPPRRCGIARRARELRGCRSCRPANANRPIACLGLLEGQGGGAGVGRGIGMILGVQGKATIQTHLIVHDSPVNFTEATCDFAAVGWYKRPTARRRGPRHRHPPGRQLEESCGAHVSSVSKAAWIGHPRPRLAARARWWPRARSLSARGGRWALDAGEHRGEQAVPRGSRAEKRGGLLQ